VSARAVVLRFGAAALILAAAILSAIPVPVLANDAPATVSAAGASPVKIKGTLFARYLYVGSSFPGTLGSSLILTGQLQVSAFSDKIVLKYRSHHWLNFAKPSGNVLESPFENRHIFQTISLETSGLLASGLKLKLGRFFPDMDYASSPVIDGGGASYESGGFTLSAVAGRMVDLWDGTQASTGLMTAAQIKYRAARFSASAGFQDATYFGLKRVEVPVGFNVFLSDDIWLEAYGGYDFRQQDIARAGLSLSWRKDGISLGAMASLWKNPFDQLYLLDKAKSLAYWGLSSPAVPSAYEDLRLFGSFGKDGWGLRGSLGFMAGVLSGWMANAYLTLPSVLGIRFSVGGQAMKSDFIVFYSGDVQATAQVGELTVMLQSQTRYYQWQPRASGFHNFDNYTEISVEYPALRHLYLSASGGGFFRQLGNEGFKPQLELRVILRL